MQVRWPSCATPRNRGEHCFRKKNSELTLIFSVKTLLLTSLTNKWSMSISKHNFSVKTFESILHFVFSKWYNIVWIFTVCVNLVVKFSTWYSAAMMQMEKSWHEALKEEMEKPYIAELKKFLESEKRGGQVIFPPEEQVFNAFRQTPYDKVNVVLMGQDPYHGPNQAEGLCFSVRKEVSLPPSLRNIYKEMESDVKIPPTSHGCLISWAKQGVLMLNATLTVRKGEPKSHFGRGWETFTDAVIRKLCRRADPLVFILWGRSAKDKCENILNTMKHPHAILTAAHPSPFSSTQFFGCRHFSKTNAVLKEWGKTPVNWSVDG